MIVLTDPPRGSAAGPGIEGFAEPLAVPPGPGVGWGEGEGNLEGGDGFRVVLEPEQGQQSQAMAGEESPQLLSRHRALLQALRANFPLLRPA
jgi:hypothetical protein